MDIIAWIVVGIIAGFLAKAVVPGEGPGGVLGDMIIGIVGAIIGGWLFNTFGHIGATGLNLWSILVAFIGGVVLLLIIRALTGRRLPAA
ncbi:MAG: GlsB/YeaQ/YmgE family stress response membrane protein [Candidatus Eremiobacteraeota bacterium]|nr:GlsB/YeaQ/YmgE family stress response membrane protein [Candidatus Eremiobacteraeota bacterium]MBV8364862.1 GlsB/YeaQ/YmgE family stress response membrane protein [Candidatus Eremiobacteraeota bacterium]